MRQGRARQHATAVERTSLQILEEAFLLLRRVDLGYYWIFYVGAVPFAIGLLYFMADMSASSLARESMLKATTVMVGLTLWLRVTQAVFCRGLWLTLQPGNRRLVRGAGEWVRQLAALFFIQAFQLPLMVVGLLLLVPVGWVIAFFQHATALTLTRDRAESSLRRLVSEAGKGASREWIQNYGVLVILLFVGLFTWINLGVTQFLVATFAKSFFGIDSVFTISPGVAIMNTTFILGSLLMAYLVISPIMKAVYTLRSFYVQSQTTGEDLLSRLDHYQRSESREESSGGIQEGKMSVKSVAVAIVLSVCALSAFGDDSESVVQTDLVSAELLESKISETMAQKKYQWQFSRRVEDQVEGNREDSWLVSQLRELAAQLKQWGDDFEQWWKDWLKRLRKKDRKPSTSSGWNLPNMTGLSSAFSIGLIILVVGLIAWGAVLLYRNYRGKEKDDEADGGGTDSIDLQSEDLVATQLPEDEWMRLAQEQMDKGEKRLAIRALFLATLAKLGDEELIKIAKSKSNWDYRVELSKKARKSEGLIAAFSENTRLFERVWYGNHEVGEETVKAYLANHETIGLQSEAAGRSRYETVEKLGNEKL